MFRVDPAPLSPRQTDTLGLLEGRGRGPCFALGRNAYAESVAGQIELDGFIDDVTGDRSFLGRPVVRMTDVPRDAAVVSCVVDGRPVTALRRLHAAGIEHVVDYFTLQRIWPTRIKPVAYMEGCRQDVTSHLDRYEWLHGRLVDDRSRAILRRIVAFRCTGDLTEMEGFEMATDRQYFEDFLPLEPGDVFVDGGGFDGATTATFCERCPSHGDVHFFEPVASAMEQAVRRLSGLSRIHFHSEGLYDHRGRLRFEGGNGPTSRISEAGSEEIDVTTLDSAVDGHVDFVKFDLEGSECAALRGAARHIGRTGPALAVCVYHSQSDFWQVPTLVLALRQDYDVHLRHYTEGVLETVMFFVPKAKWSRPGPHIS